MVDAVIKKYGPFFEKLILWVIEGKKSPFCRDYPPRLKTTQKSFRKMRNKNKALAVLAHAPIHQKA